MWNVYFYLGLSSFQPMTIGEWILDGKIGGKRALYGGNTAQGTKKFSVGSDLW